MILITAALRVAGVVLIIMMASHLQRGLQSTVDARIPQIEAAIEAATNTGATP